jgi:hypothetical protein
MIRYNLNHRVSSIALLIALFISCSPLKKYSEQAKKWEPDIAAFEQLDKSEQDPKNAILFAGSSSIRLWSTIKEDMAPYEVIQRGFGGSEYSDLAWYTKRIVYPHHFKAVVIFVANDITGSKEDKTPGEIANLARYVIKTIRKEYPVQPIFLVEITPTRSRWQHWPKIKQANNALKSLSSEKKKIYFIETAERYLNEKGEPREELFKSDQLHQNREGYIIWGELIKQKLNEVLKQ